MPDAVRARQVIDPPPEFYDALQMASFHFDGRAVLFQTTAKGDVVIAIKLSGSGRRSRTEYWLGRPVAEHRAACEQFIEQTAETSAFTEDMVAHAIAQLRKLDPKRPKETSG